jgi:hypothetical protein
MCHFIEIAITFSYGELRIYLTSGSLIVPRKIMIKGLFSIKIRFLILSLIWLKKFIVPTNDSVQF